MIQKLIILGFLKNKPSTGYDIKKFIEKELGIFSELNTKSIYYPLKKMQENGFIYKKELKTNTHIKKYIYSLTQKGEREFINLCKEILLSNRRPFIDIDIPLFFLPYLNRKDVLARLRLRKRFLEKVKVWLKSKLEQKNKFLGHQILLLKHHLNLLNAEESFLREFIEFIKNYSK